MFELCSINIFIRDLNKILLNNGNINIQMVLSFRLEEIKTE